MNAPKTQEQWHDLANRILRGEVDHAVLNDLWTGNILPTRSIRHVYDSQGSHCIEVNGIRGDFARYENIATHPDGYLAITDYYGGVDPKDVETLFARGLRDVVPWGGMVWQISRVQWVVHSTVPEGWNESVTPDGDVLTGALDPNPLTVEQTSQYFEYCNRAYQKEFPRAKILQDLHDEYVKAHPHYAIAYESDLESA